MKILVKTALNMKPAPQVAILPAFSKTIKGKGKKKDESQVVLTHLPKDIQNQFKSFKGNDYFKGQPGQTYSLHLEDGYKCVLLGLGEKTKVDAETLRKQIASVYKLLAGNYTAGMLCLDSFNLLKGHDKSASVLAEALGMASYAFDKYLKESNKPKLQTIYFMSKENGKKAKVQQAIDAALDVAESVNFARNLVNEPPNVLRSTAFVKFVQDDLKKTLKGSGIKVKVMGKADLKREKMGLFLSVNAGSSYEPQLVHLTYTPKGKAKKHIAMVGKGLVFDTGGYSLKPSPAMINMKFDMAGAATVYGAFRAAVMAGSKNKITCILGITDNAISGEATMPDSICQARNGLQVEILNTDAEGRLVLADCLDYACDQKPDAIIDAATLTGAVLVALGHEVCGLFSNNDKLAKELEGAAKATDEYMWRLPLIDEYRNDMKSPIADLKNIGGSRFAGSAKAAVFLENFVKNDIAWAHLDIAGIGDSQAHLPYCPPKGASGSIVRTLKNYLMS